jgi:hypothetical protein
MGVLCSQFTMGLVAVALAIFFVQSAPKFLRRMSVVLSGFGTSEVVSSGWIFGLVIVAAGVFWPVWDSHMLYEKEDGSVWTGGSCWADFPIHMHILQSVLVGRNQAVSLTGMHSPIFADRPMSYPYLPDFHAAVIVWHGASVRQAFFATGFLSFLAFVGLLFSLGARLTSSRVAGVLGVAVLLCMGGVGGIRLLQHFGFPAVLDKDPVQDDMVNGVFSGGSVFWFAFMPHIFLPQRSATLAYPAILLAMLVMWQVIRPSRPGASQDRSFLLMFCAGICGMLPLVQAHAFVAMAAFVGTIFVLEAPAWLADHDLLLRGWLPAGLIAAVFFAPQWLVFSRMVESSNRSFLELIALYNGHGSSAPAELKAVLGQSGFAIDFVWFWIRALGPFVPLFLGMLLSYTPMVVRLLQGTLDPSAAESIAHPLASPALLDSASPLDCMDDSVRQLPRLHTVKPREERSKSEDDARAVTPPLYDGEALPQHRGGWATHGEEVFETTDPDEPFGFLSRHPVDRATSVPRSLEALVRGPVDPASGVASPAMDVASLDEQRDPIGAFTRYATSQLGKAQTVLALGDATDVHLRELSALKFALGSLAVWVMSTYVKFQPWDKDNTKVFYVWAFIAAPLVARAMTFPLMWGLQALTHSSSHQVNDLPDADAAIRKMDTATASTAQSASFVRRGLGIVSLIVGIPLLVALALAGGTSGALGLIREFRMFHDFYGVPEKEVAAFLIEHVDRRAVILHDNDHRSPVGMLAGRPSLASYDGWLWSHGYDYGERHNDRNWVMGHVVEQSNDMAYQKLRRWGVRYVVAAHKPQPDGNGPDKNLFLGDQLKRIFKNGRYQVFEVLGYGFPPS